VPKIKEAVEADPASKEKITKLLQSASDREKQRAFGDAFQFFKTLAETVSTVLGGGNPKQQYEEALPGAELKVKTLKEHPQAAAIKAELDPIERSLKLAKSLAQGGKYADALKELAKIDKEYPDAKELADTIKLAREIESSMVIQLNNFELHQGIGAIAPDKVAELRTAIGSLDGHIKARNFGDFDTVTSDVNGKLDAYKVKANRHGDYVGLRNNALVNVEVLEAHPNKEAIKDKIAAIKKDFIDKAKVEYETNNSYEKARALLEQVEGKYKDAKKLADDKGGADFKKEVDAIKLKVADLEKPEKKNPELDAEVAAIKTKLATAEKYAATKQYPDADKLLEEIKQACTAAEKLAAEQVAFNGDEKAAGTAIGDIAKKSQAAVDAVQKLHDHLEKHTNASAITFELGEIQKKIDEAKAALK
jgi:hypothetical protein